MDVQPFALHTPESTLSDLQDRLRNVRWPDEIAGSNWSQGTELDFMKEIVNFWLTKFDWPAHENAINKFSHFRADVDVRRPCPDDLLFAA